MWVEARSVEETARCGGRIFGIIRLISVIDQIRERSEQVRRLARSHRGRSVCLFGSCARREETPTSDIDFLIDFAPGATLFGLADLQMELEALLGRPVDIVPTQSLKEDAFGRRVRGEMVAI